MESISQYTGAKAEERALRGESSSYLQNFGSYIQGFSSYLPKSIKKQLPTGTTTVSSEEKDVLVWSAFDYLELKGKRRQFLALGYTTGFQVWDLQHPDNFHEIVSKREVPIKCIKFLPNPLQNEAPHHPLYGKRPIIAIASSTQDGNFPNNLVKLYSLKTNEYVNALKFRTEVHSILCSKRLLVVGLKHHLYGFDCVTMEKLFTLECSSPPGVMSLGPRWLAYPGVSTGNNAPASRQSASDKLVEVAKDVAKDIASSLYYLGQKTLTDYVYAEDSTNNNVQNNAVRDDSSHPGIVVVFDVVTRKPVAQFQAHAQPLSALSFDPSGTLLVTASVEGHNFNVYQIVPNSPEGIYGNFRHIYKLQRGLTNATIQHISFSDDSRWMAISSSRGTTRNVPLNFAVVDECAIDIYAINPTAGPVNIHTHLRSPQSEGPVYAVSTDQSNHPLLTLPACNRIKTTVQDDGHVAKDQHIPPIASAFVGHPFATEKIFVVNPNGMLTQFQLKPHKPAPGTDLDPSTLQLDIEPIVEWDVCRRAKWPEVHVSVQAETTEPTTATSNQEVEWLSNVEICNHNPAMRPLWSHPQFSFKRFEPVKPETIPSDTEYEKQYLFYESTPAKKVEVRHNDPMPFKEGGVLMEIKYVDGNQQYVAPQSAPEEIGASNYSDDDLKENIFKAMSTPMDAIK